MGYPNVNMRQPLSPASSQSFVPLMYVFCRTFATKTNIQYPNWTILEGDYRMPLTIKRKTEKEERLSLRVTARDKFAVDLYGRMTEKTISAIAKEALEMILKKPETGLYRKIEGEDKYLPDLCWDPLEPDRLLKLAKFAPDLMSDIEQVTWKVISGDATYFRDFEQTNLDAIRDNWDEIKLKAEELYKRFA